MTMALVVEAGGSTEWKGRVRDGTETAALGRTTRSCLAVPTGSNRSVNYAFKMLTHISCWTEARVGITETKTRAALGVLVLQAA